MFNLDEFSDLERVSKTTASYSVYIQSCVVFDSATIILQHLDSNDCYVNMHVLK